MAVTCGLCIALMMRAVMVLGILAHSGVDGRDDPVQRFEHVVGVVESAVSANVDLGTGQQFDVAEPVFQQPDFVNVFLQAFDAEAVRYAPSGRVVGDGDIFVAALAGGHGHELRGITPVAPLGVDVKVALEIGDLH